MACANVVLDSRSHGGILDQSERPPGLAFPAWLRGDRMRTQASGIQTASSSPGLRARRSPLLATLLSALAVYGCGGGDLGECGGPFCVRPPTTQQATRLLPSSGDGQTGVPGREL